TGLTAAAAETTALPGDGELVRTGDSLRLGIDSGNGPGALLISRKQASQPAPAIAARAWQLAEIDAGLPEIGAATTALFVPQMLNLHWLGAVAFDKGCYPGQEIVA